MPRTDTLPDFPVVVVHLEDPPGSGLAACCGQPYRPSTWTSTSRWLCTGCANAGRPREAVAAERARIRAAVEKLFDGWIVDQPDDEEALELERAAVLAIIDERATPAAEGQLTMSDVASTE